MENLTLLIPAKFESESLPSVLDELKKFNYKICIILKETDSSTINSIVDFDVEIIHQKGIGYGDALIEGINYCKTKYFCIFNADGSFKPTELEHMYDLSKNHDYDLVFGSRYEKNASSEDDTLVTLVGNKIFSLIGKLFFSLPITDILYTYVLGKTKKTNQLNLSYRDFCLCVELPIKASKNKFRINEVPIIISYEAPFSSAQLITEPSPSG